MGSLLPLTNITKSFNDSAVFNKILKIDNDNDSDSYRYLHSKNTSRNYVY